MAPRDAAFQYRSESFLHEATMQVKGGFSAHAQPMFLSHRHFLKLLDLAPNELQQLVNSALTFKELRRCAQERPGLRPKDVALLFQTSSQNARPPQPAWATSIGGG